MRTRELENKETFENSYKVNIWTLSTDNYCHPCSQATINTPIFRYSLRMLNWPWDILNGGLNSFKSIYQSWLPVFSHGIFIRSANNKHVTFRTIWFKLAPYHSEIPEILNDFCCTFFLKRENQRLTFYLVCPVLQSHSRSLGWAISSLEFLNCDIFFVWEIRWWFAFLPSCPIRAWLTGSFIPLLSCHHSGIAERILYFV